MTELTNNIEINFVDFYVSSINFLSPNPEADFTQNIVVDLNYRIVITENDSDNVFFIVFEITMKNEKEDFQIYVQTISAFSCNQKLTEDLANTDLFVRRAPEMAFPYLRSFISSFLTNAGYPTLYLNAINFSQMKPSSIETIIAEDSSS